MKKLFTTLKSRVVLASRTGVAVLLALAYVGIGMGVAEAAAGDLYALGNTTGDGSAAMELYVLDKSSASSTFVASTETAFLRGLAIDPATEKFYSAYGSAGRTTKRGIVEIDPVTGAVTDIGGTKALVALAFDSSGQLYGAENARQGKGNVYKVSTIDGAETYLGTVTVPQNDFGNAPGLAFNRSENALYYQSVSGEISTIDTTSGVETFLGTVTSPWPAHSFDFDESGNVYYHQHPASGVGLAFAGASDIFTPTIRGVGSVSVWGLSYQRVGDTDGDGISDADDNCPEDANSDQADLDDDGEGNACDDDDDGDGVLDGADNCPLDVNPNQDDLNGDGAGDACDSDYDGDGVLDAVDACLYTPAAAITNSDGCAIADLCPCIHPDGSDNWKNHGKYVSCASHAAKEFVKQGLISNAQKGAIVAAAGRSACGKKSNKRRKK